MGLEQLRVRRGRRKKVSLPAGIHGAPSRFHWQKGKAGLQTSLDGGAAHENSDGDISHRRPPGKTFKSSCIIIKKNPQRINRCIGERRKIHDENLSSSQNLPTRCVFVLSVHNTCTFIMRASVAASVYNLLEQSL